ncbi:hypothetical protein SB49_00505 [Sediminicola sp. YIK13]|uniref:beta strand repeat-containing protein n=1 Tax=Sediminicola sp. YIK13 TaxID=1453352 RepID=UPI000720A297|nr:hypothetical protein [Sediminicola sp. YIK13]ALM06458.1 hypothetical protein SB49_00505 [Sediminicola sp. YIK13]
MKLKVVFLFIGLVLGSFSHAQIKIGTNPQNINAASVLELESTSRALVLTRVNNTQMDAINPLQGALVYNTETKCVHYYDGSQWLNICDALTNSANISMVDNGDGSYTFTDAVGVETIITTTTNSRFEVANDSLVLTDSNNNALSVALDSLNRHTYSTDAIVNLLPINDSTIVIRRTGNNFNFEVGEITGSNIQDRSIRNVDIGPTAINGDFHIQNRSTPALKLIPGTTGQLLQTQTVTGQPTVVWVNKAGLFSAVEVSYNPVDSGLTANTVKLALDELAVTSTDNQDLTGLPLSTANELIIDIENGTSATVDLSSLEESADIAAVQADVDQNEADADAAIAQKEDSANKSDDGTLADNSAVDFPTEQAVKTYVDNAITGSNTLADAFIFVGDAANTAQAVPVSGDATMDNTGVLTIANDAVTTTKIADANVTDAKLDKANISLSGFAIPTADLSIGTFKLTNVVDPLAAQDAATKNYVDNAVSGSNSLANANIFVGNAAGTAQAATVSGDATIDNTGALTIANDAVTTTKIADANVTEAKLDKANISLSGFAIPTADLSIGTFKLTNVVDPLAAQDAATKNYVDNAVSGSNSLANANIFVGNAAGTAQAAPVSGDATIDNTGALTIANDAVTTTKIADANVTDAKLDKANISLSGFAVPIADLSIGSFKLTNVSNPLLATDAANKSYVDNAITGSNALANANIFVGNAAGTAQAATVSGDATIDNTGALTIANDAVTTTKIADANVTDAKLDKANISLSGFAVPIADLSIGSFKLTDVSNPLLATDAANKSYVDNAITGSNALANANIFVGNAAGTAQATPVSGDATIDNAGALTIANDAVTTTKIANANVTPQKIEPSATNGQVLKTVSGATIWANQFHAIGKMNAEIIANGINISSVAPLGTGNYQVDFSTAANSSDYVIQLTLGTGLGREIRVTTQTDNNFTIQITNSSGNPVDSAWFFTVTDF